MGKFVLLWFLAERCRGPPRTQNFKNFEYVGDFIYISADKTIRIVFKYEDEYNSAIDFIKKHNYDIIDENHSENIYNYVSVDFYEFLQWMNFIINIWRKIKVINNEILQ